MVRLTDEVSPNEFDFPPRQPSTYERSPLTLKDIGRLSKSNVNFCTDRHYLLNNDIEEILEVDSSFVSTSIAAEEPKPESCGAESFS